MSNAVQPLGQLLPYCFLFASVAIVIVIWPQIAVLFLLNALNSPSIPALNTTFLYSITNA